MTRAASASSWIVATSLLLAGCPGDGEPDLVPRQFNGEDVVEVVVGPGDAAEVVEADLSSSTGEAVVGTVRVAPAAGPVGTEHRVTVQVGAAYADRIEIVEIIADAEDRGEQVIALEQDSADERIWVRTVTSYGFPDEARTDTFTIVLYELVEELPAS